MLIERTIRLLRENNVSDIALSTLDDRYLQFGLPILKHYNPMTFEGLVWLRCFYPADYPVCYLCGDVFYSDAAIKTIVETQTDDIEFFASAPPFGPMYIKSWAEPFGFKVQDYERFRRCVDETIRLEEEGKFNRMAISWELWQVIKGTELNRVDYTNYIAINDYTVDVDNETAARLLDRYA